MRKFARLGLLLVSALAIAGSTTVPAQAADSITIRFNGQATVSPGLQTGVVKDVTFSFSSLDCTGTVEGKNTTAPPPPLASCSISVTGGTGTGTCGHLSGVAEVYIEIGTTSYTGKITIATTAGEIHYVVEPLIKDNTNQKGAGGGDATAVPTNPTDCSSPTGATSYTILNGVFQGAVA